MASGLVQRRRTAGQSSSTQDEDVSGTWSPISRDGGGGGTGSSTPTGNGHAPGPLHAGTAFEGGSKIAFDPRDLEAEDADVRTSGGKVPRLTIMEEVLLLGIKDKQVQDNLDPC